MVGSFLILLTIVIIGTILFLGLVLHWSSTERDRIDSLDCNELWEEIIDNEKEFGRLGESVFAKWITKECWS